MIVQRATLAFAAITQAVLLAATVQAGVVQLYNGAVGELSVDSGFAAATASQAKESIDFDNDGFVFTSNVATIPADCYWAKGVTLLNLEARKYPSNETSWTHSPPVGAWHTGFPDSITTPYSFVFTQPVASVGMFANDLEASLTATVYFATGTETFLIPASGGASISQFHGFVTGRNIIHRIDFTTVDYHGIDDIQFGHVVPEPGTLVLLFAGVMALLARGRRGRRA